jgi:glutamate 5-kinase
MASAESTSGIGSGGMISKLQAAEIAELAGICLVIGNGQHDRPLARIVEEGVGTLFMPRRNAGARKAWLGGRLRLKGEIVVDAGAAAALRRGSSLLAKGIVAVEGVFSRGDPVAILDSGGKVLAHGLSEYDATECAAIVGLHSSEQEVVLGYAPRSAVVHRDQMVLKS